MRPSHWMRAAPAAVALSLATIGATVLPTAASATASRSALPASRRALPASRRALVTAPLAAPLAASLAKGSQPTASIARVGVGSRHLEVRAGRHAAVHGTVLPRRAGMRALLQVRRPWGWTTLDRDRTDAHGRYHLSKRVRTPMSGPARVLVRSHGHGLERRLGRINVYRYAHASWYGPGLYGNHLGCGGHLGYGTIGVANKSLPCGTRLTLRHAGCTLRVRVVDRGPYVAGREYDLTAATARRLHFHGHGPILTTR